MPCSRAPALSRALSCRHLVELRCWLPPSPVVGAASFRDLPVSTFRVLYCLLELLALSLGAAVAASAKRKRERAKGGTPSSPPKAPPRVQASGRRSKSARSRRGLEHSDAPAPRALASPESVSPQRSPLRGLPRRAQPRGAVAESAIGRRPAAFSAPEGQGRAGEGPSWFWEKKWAESYLSEGGILQLSAIHWGAGIIQETWQWKELP